MEPKKFFGHGTGHTVIAGSKNGVYFTGGSEGYLIQRNLHDETDCRVDDHGGSSVTSIALSEDGNLLATGSTANAVRLYDGESFQFKRVVAEFEHPVRHLDWHPLSRSIAVATDDGCYLCVFRGEGSVFDVDVEKILLRLGSVRSLAFGPVDVKSNAAPLAILTQKGEVFACTIQQDGEASFSPPLVTLPLTLWQGQPEEERTRADRFCWSASGLWLPSENGASCWEQSSPVDNSSSTSSWRKQLSLERDQEKDTCCLWEMTLQRSTLEDSATNAKSANPSILGVGTRHGHVNLYALPSLECLASVKVPMDEPQGDPIAEMCCLHTAENGHVLVFTTIEGTYYTWDCNAAVKKALAMQEEVVGTDAMDAMDVPSAEQTALLPKKKRQFVLSEASESEEDDLAALSGDEEAMSESEAGEETGSLNEDLPSGSYHPGSGSGKEKGKEGGGHRHYQRLSRAAMAEQIAQLLPGLLPSQAMVQEPFQVNATRQEPDPSCQDDDDAPNATSASKMMMMGEGNLSFLAYNEVGMVICREDNTNSTVRVEFHNAAKRRPLSFSTFNEVKWASLSSHGVFLGYAATEDAPAGLMYRAFEKDLLAATAAACEWELHLPFGEAIVSVVACGEKYVAAVTDAFIVRLFSTAGVQLACWEGSGLPLTLCGRDQCLGIFSHASTQCVGDSQQILLHLWDMDRQQCLTPAGESVPLSRGSVLRWCGLTPQGQMAIYDSEGKLSLRRSQAFWTPLQISGNSSHTPHTSPDGKGKSGGGGARESREPRESLWIVGLSQLKLAAVVLRQGQTAPACTPRPVLTVRPVVIPACHDTGDDFIQSMLTFPLLHPNAQDDTAWDQLLLKLFHAFVSNNQAHKGLSLCEHLRLSKSLEIANKLASHFQLTALGQAISDLWEKKYQVEQLQILRRSSASMADDEDDLSDAPFPPGTRRDYASTSRQTHGMEKRQHRQRNVGGKRKREETQSTGLGEEEVEEQAMPEVAFDSDSNEDENGDENENENENENSSSRMMEGAKGKDQGPQANLPRSNPFITRRPSEANLSRPSYVQTVQKAKAVSSKQQQQQGLASTNKGLMHLPNVKKGSAEGSVRNRVKSRNSKKLALGNMQPHNTLPSKKIAAAIPEEREEDATLGSDNDVLQPLPSTSAPDSTAFA